MAISATTPFRPKRVTPKPRFYGTMNAFIDGEQDGKYAELDDKGRYKVILPFDRVDKAGGKASSWIRMATDYAGEKEGLNFPLHKGTEVLLSFLNGDPDQPTIIGAVPNATKPSLVKAENQTISKLQTRAGNRIEIEDKEDRNRIKLYSPKCGTYMHLEKFICLSPFFLSFKTSNSPKSLRP